MFLINNMLSNQIITNIIVIAINILIIGGAIIYFVKAKKSGQKCIGCPYSKTCKSGQSNEKCSCSSKK